MTERQAHSIVRNTCFNMLKKMLDYIEYPISVVKASERHQNPDYKHKLIRRQKRVLSQLRKVRHNLKQLAERFDY